MTDLVEHRAPERPDPDRVVALCDQALAMAGLPTYTEQTEHLRQWGDTIGARIEAMALGTAIAETRRLRTAHGIVAHEIAAASSALAAGDVESAHDFLDEAAAFAKHHAVLETRAPLPDNVVLLAAHRVVRVASDLRGL